MAVDDLVRRLVLMHLGRGLRPACRRLGEIDFDLFLDDGIEGFEAGDADLGDTRLHLPAT